MIRVNQVVVGTTEKCRGFTHNQLKSPRPLVDTLLVALAMKPTEVRKFWEVG